MSCVIIGWAIIWEEDDPVGQCVPYYDMADWLRDEYHNKENINEV